MLGWIRDALESLRVRDSSLDTKTQERNINRGREFEIPNMISSRVVRRNPVSGMFSPSGSSLSAIRREDPETGNIYTSSAEISDTQYLSPSHSVDEDTRVVQVPSSAVDSVRYDPKSHHMWLRYTSSPKEYVFRVNPQEFRQFMNAGSKGRYTQQVLRKRNRAPRSWWS